MFFKKCIAVSIVTGVLSCSFSVFAAQSVSTLRNSYTGSTQWDGGSGTLTFSSSGTIRLNGRPQHFDSVWEVPSEVKNVVINSNVTVTGQLHFSSDASLLGKNKNTSVIFGTKERGYTANRDGLKASTISTVFVKGGNLNVKNLTSLDPKGFHFTARGKDKLNLDSVRAIDSRGGAGNNSDGYVGGDGSVVKNSFFETGDDIFKVYYGTTKYINNTVVMVQNTVPIQLGWGTGIDNNSVGNFEGLYVSGTSGRGNDSRALIIHREGKLSRTINIDDMIYENPNGAIISQRETGMKLNLNVSNALIDVSRWAGYNRGSVSSTICGGSQKTNFYLCRENNTPTPTPTPTPPSQSNLPGVIEAENFVRQNGVKVESRSSASGGKNIGYIQNGDWAEYAIEAPQSGNYDIHFRVSTQKSGGTINVKVDNSNAGSVNVTSTGGWNNWVDVTLRVRLNAGKNTLRTDFNGGNGFLFNVDSLDIQ